MPMSAAGFKRQYLSLVLLAWMVPPVVGLGFILYLHILTPKQMAGILTTPLELLYIFGWLAFAVWYFPRLVRPIICWLESGAREDGQHALAAMRCFPFRFWLIFLVYLVLAPGVVIIAAEYYTDFVAQPVDWFRIQLVALIVSIIVGLPIFFRFMDLFGRSLGAIRLAAPHVTLTSKVFLIGALVPLLIDTLLVQYFWTRTGYFTLETFFVWLALELLAVGGSLIFVKSIGQSLAPLQRMITRETFTAEPEYAAMLPMSTDELGVLTTAYRQLVRDISIHNELLALNNTLLGSAGEAAGLAVFIDSVIALCAKAIEGEKVSLLLADEQEGTLVCVAQTGLVYNAGGYFELDLRERSLPALAYTEGETLVADDSSTEGYTGICTFGQTECKSMLVTPLKSRESTPGILVSLDCSRTRHYTKRDITLMESLAQEAAMALNAVWAREMQLKAEAEHARQDARYRSLVEATTAIPWELDLSSQRYVYIGHQAEAVLGYPLADWSQENFLQDHVYVDDLAAVVDFWKSVANQEGNREIEYRMIAADGRRVWIRSDARVVRENNQQPRLQGFMFDITSHKEVEISLSKSESRLVEAQRIAGVGSWELDIASDSLYWSDEIFRIFEIQPADFRASYEAFLQIVHPEDRGVVDEAYRHSLETTQPYDIEHRLLMRDGRIKYVHEYCETQYNRAGQPIRSVGTVQDITERVVTEQELRDHREKLEQLVEERTGELKAVNDELEAFNYSVSHDLRAPVRAVDGFSEILLEEYGGALDDAGRDYLERIRANAGRMKTLIDDLLALSRLGRAEMKIEPVDIAALGEQVFDALKAAEPERQVNFEVDISGNVMADVGFLRIVLENLIGNAWKYSRDRKPAEIRLGETLHNGQPVYYVRDNGAGFDMTHSDQLFVAFQRLHQDEEFEGTGVGLATVARVIHRHGGEIWAESERGKGATFYFSLGRLVARDAVAGYDF